MIHIISDKKNSYGMLEYDQEGSIDHRLFFEGASLAGTSAPLIYRVKRKSDIAKLVRFHIIESMGPTLVSRQLREAIERAAASEVEFFDAAILHSNTQIQGFSAINITSRMNCVNLTKSEYDVANFDPANPRYILYYAALADEFPEPANIAICNEQHSWIIVNEKIKVACLSADLKGLLFCRAIDLTPRDRSVCEEI